MFLSLAILIGGLFAPPTTDLYVAASGNDSNVGTISQPWRTIAKVNSSTTTGKNVHFNGGDTFNDAVLALQSSTNYDSYGTGRAIMSGGVTVTTWTLQSGNIWRTPFTAGIPRALWVNGTRVVRAHTSTGLPSGTQNSTGYTGTGGYLSTYGNQSDIEMVYFTEWRNCRVPVLSAGGSTITMANTPFADFLILQAFNGFSTLPTYVENAYEIFSANNTLGTFYLDRTAHFLYLIPPTGVSDPNAATVIAPIGEEIMTGTGVSNINISELEFDYTTNLDINTNGFNDIQGNWLINGPSIPKAAVTVTNASNVVFTRNLIRHLGDAGLEFQGTCVGCGAFGNIVYDASSCGIIVGNPGQNAGACPSTTTVSNNYVAECALEFLGGVQIQQYYAGTSLITHNVAAYGSYSGITCGISGTNTPQPTGNLNNTISFNEVFNVMLSMNDGGGVYLNSQNQGTSVSSNYCHDIGQSSWPGPGVAQFDGIYFDDGTTNASGSNNVVVQAKTHPFFFNNNISGNVLSTNTADGGAYTVIPGSLTVSPNTYDTLIILSTSAARAAGVALGSGLQSSYADVLAEAQSLIP